MLYSAVHLKHLFAASLVDASSIIACSHSVNYSLSMKGRVPPVTGSYFVTKE